MKLPKLDPRSRDDIREALARLARSYTPEWRCDGAEDDPGAALAELFCQMHAETVERLNALPEKLYLEFLNELGFREPDPAPSRGVMCFTPHETLEEPVPVPRGTQVFATDEDGENIVYETTQAIEATAAQLRELYYVDGRADEIRRVEDFSRPRRFFDPNEGESVQRHLLRIGEENVLRLDCPATVTLRLTPQATYLQDETAERLAAQDMKWYYFRDGEEVPFDEVHAQQGGVVLTKRSRDPMDVDEDGRTYLCCEGRPDRELRLERVELSSAPIEPCFVKTAFSGDIPIPPGQGGVCFTRRPAPYEMLYLRCDAALSKKGANALLHLGVSFVIDEPPEEEIQYEYGANIIEVQKPSERKLDDVTVSGVLWEYFNGLGWRQLPVTGDVNPFASGTAGSYALSFTVPDDLEETEVNAQTGLYLRARVTAVENLGAINQRWIVPYLQSASFTWDYGTKAPAASRLYAENNGQTQELNDCGDTAHLDFPAFTVMEPDDQAMYFRFEGSPNAMPLSLRFRVWEGARMEKLLWEAWDGRMFTAVQCLDGTENLGRSGEVCLYLPEPLAERELFGETGCWLRLSRTADRREQTPVVLSVVTNAVDAVQSRREPEQLFDTEVYEAGKTLQLLAAPVQSCEVWVDEMRRLSETEARAMAAAGGGRVRLEMDGHRIRRCWVLWERAEDLTLAGAEERVYALDAYEGVIRFGNGVFGRVPPEGEQNIRVLFTSGGGERGNVPQGAVTNLLGGLPSISTEENLTPMTGGTDRWSLGRIEALGNRRLRHQWRAVSAQDFEDIVSELFPRVRHVRCFKGTDAAGNAARGEVTVVIAGRDESGESMNSLCREVEAELLRRCSCCLAAEGRLHVRAALELTVNTTILIEVERLEAAAQTQQEIVERLRRLIGDEWQRRPIGEQLRLRELWSAVRETANVRSIRRILPEGAFDENGVRKLIPLERDDYPFAVVSSGMHTVKLL